MAIPIDYLFLSSFLTLEVVSKVDELEVNIIRFPRCATCDKSIAGLDILMPSEDSWVSRLVPSCLSTFSYPHIRSLSWTGIW
jgi:hypothetical protein